jgi:ureidoglycolate hydrolase
MAKVSLDALIPREAFDVQDRQAQNTGRNITHLSIRDLEQNSFFFVYVRKPDFQRETNEWDEKKICDFIESFLDGDLIPAVILWRSPSSY